DAILRFWLSSADYIGDKNGQCRIGASVQTASFRLGKEEHVMHRTPRQHTRAEDAGLPFYAGRTRGDVEHVLVWRWLHDDPACPSRVLLAKVAETRTPLPVSVRQRHRLRVLGQRKRPKGRPRHAEGRPPGGSGAARVQVTPRLACV